MTKNLLRVALDAELRFTMLETIREFGLAQLTADQELEQMQRQHAHYFAQLVASQWPRLMGAESADALAQLRAAHPNVRVAFQRLLAQRETDRCLRLFDVARGQLNAEVVASAWATGEAMTLDATVAYALQVPG